MLGSIFRNFHWDSLTKKAIITARKTIIMITMMIMMKIYPKQIIKPARVAITTTIIIILIPMMKKE